MGSDQQTHNSSCACGGSSNDPASSSPTFSFQLLSDIHLEFIRRNIDVQTQQQQQQTGDGGDGDRQAQQMVVVESSDGRPIFDVGEPLAENLALLGDIGLVADGPMWRDLQAFVRSCCSKFRRVFFVHGNHEAYHSSLLEVRQKLSALAGEMPAGKLVFMDKTAFDVPETDVRILGCTLWTRVAPPARRILNDFNTIHEFSFEKCLELHSDHAEWIADELARAHRERKRAIVFTHHAPCHLNGVTPHENYEWEATYRVCGTDLVPTVFNCDTAPALQMWCFGHTHWSCDFVLGGVRIVSNQVGYPEEMFKKLPEYVAANVQKVLRL
eukprot:gnl/Spiro4/28571_TR14129_c0_g1_i1.p1 gnl/Spiro4/28571_TR14129_c0_g1~~gnl/Spiro4/28571_TR14129_c0_g1_i1.p1  ORF type:complete len:336 (+),score=99.26 gnl/Spiro4/28571_TR14129_c0_g1_i1:31-1008(+)